MRESFLRATARLACRHDRAVLAAAVLLTVAALTPILRSGYSSSFNVARMLPQAIPASRAFTRSLTDFGTADEAVIVFHLNPDRDDAIDIAGSLADRIAIRLRTHPDIRTAFATLLTEEERDELLYTELPRRGLLFLPPEDIEAVRVRLEPAEIRRQVRRTARLLSGALSTSDTQEQILLNVLGLGTIFRESIAGMLPQEPQEDPDIEPYTGPYLVAPDRSMLLLVISPRIPAQSVHFSRRIMDEIRDVAYEEIEGVTPLAAGDATDWAAVLERWRRTAEAGVPHAGAILYESLRPADRHRVQQYIDAPAEADLPAILAILNQTLRTDTMAQRLSARAHPRAATVADLLRREADTARRDATAVGLEPGALRAARLLRLQRRLLHMDDEAVANVPGSPLTQSAKEAFRMELGGGYAIARAYSSKLNWVLLSTLLLSAVLVLFFFGYSFRRAGVLLFVGVPLCMIISWTLGVGWILFEQLNIISCAFAAVLVGLGVDYGVHIYNRYIEERARGVGVEESFSVSLAHTGWGVLIGMATTCLAFAALHATRFSQLAEFGVLASIGIALSVPAMMLVMPALVVWRSRWGHEPLRAMRPSAFFLPRVAGWVESSPRRIALGGGLVAAVCLLLLFGVRGSLVFDPRMENLRPQDRSFELNGEIAAAFATRNPNKLTFMTTAESEADALTLMASYEERLRVMEREGLILGFESVTRYLPPPEEQARRLERIRTIDFDQALETFRDALDQEGMHEEPFSFTFRLLREHRALAEEGGVLLPSEFAHSKIARLVSGYVARRRQEYYIDDNRFPDADTVTLARAAQSRDGRHVYHPAGATLTREQVRDINRPDMPYGARVNPITIYEGGWAVKSSIFPVIPEGSETGEPEITDDWIGDVAGILDLPPALFAAEADDIDHPVVLTGVAVVGNVLGRVVKEDFLHISFWIFGIALFVVNLFYHPHPLRALVCAVPLFTLLVSPSLLGGWGAADTLDGRLVWVGTALLMAGGSLGHRRIAHTLYCFLPVVLGLVYLFGAAAGWNLIAGVLGLRVRLDLNFVNVLTIPIIIGVGIDNGIHLVNRYFEDGRRVRPVIVDTGRALTITALTSMFGFGSLYLAKFQGLGSMASLGLLSVLALGMVLLASVLVFPAILSVCSPRDAGQGADTVDAVNVANAVNVTDTKEKKDRENAEAQNRGSNGVSA